MTLHANGRAEIDVFAPEKERGRFYASVSKAEFRELSNLIALLRLDRRGGLVPTPPGEAATPIVRAGCKDEWSVEANAGGAAGEVEGVAQCLVDFRNRADWSTR